MSDLSPSTYHSASESGPDHTSDKQMVTNDVFYLMVQGKFLNSWRDICSLRQTSKDLARILGPALYRKDIRYVMSVEEDNTGMHFDPDVVDPRLNPDGSNPLDQPRAKIPESDSDEPEDSDSDYDNSDSDGHSDDNEFNYYHLEDELTRRRDRRGEPYVERHEAHLDRPTCWSLETTALHWAAKYNYVDMLKLILKYALHVDPVYLDAKVKGGKTALAVAAESGSIEAIQMLIAAGAFVDAPSPYSSTFTRKFQGARLRYLDPDHPVRFRERRTQFLTPLVHAIRRREEAAAILLAQHTEHLSSGDWDLSRVIVSPLNMAVKKGMINVIKALISRGYIDCGRALEHERERETLCVASSTRNNHEMIGMLLDLGLDIGMKGCWGWYAIEWAIHSKCHDNALYLLGREDPNYVGERIVRALRRALLHDRHLEVTKVLAERFNSQGRFDVLQEQLREFLPSEKPVSKYRVETLRYLVDLMAVGLNKDYLEDGQTYLHCLLKKPDCDAILGEDLDFMLSMAGDTFDINATDAEGHTALDYAILNGDQEAEDALRERGCGLSEVVE
ncbi:ankyrin repeat-containing domain protein [Annulohypoxylon bovei var. microspora]|nr:ankyrin repeat-containing domain protein [Annulohypoxylon bovei var. microspora]